jgi:hypothetical protein
MVYELFGFQYASMVATLLWSVVIGLIGYYAIFKLPLFDSLLKEPMAAPTMVLPAGMFSFLMVFMASQAWQNISEARLAQVNEHSALTRMVAVPFAPPETKQHLQAAIKRYLRAVVDDEWTRRYNESEADAADAALAELQIDIWAIDAACQAQAHTEKPCTNGLAISSFVKALDDLRLARDQRLSLGYQGGLPLKWTLAISLAIATSLTLAAVHRSSPRTAAISLGLFSLSIWLSFSVVTLTIQPYRGPTALSPAMLQAIRDKV